jgi:4-hydroxy-tetrahydrodipicolinate reductase
LIFTARVLGVCAKAQEALLGGCDVFVEYTRPEAPKTHELQALAAGAHGVVGKSGLTDEDHEESDLAAKKAGRGILAAGNFSLTKIRAGLITEESQKFFQVLAMFDPDTVAHKNDISG